MSEDLLSESEIAYFYAFDSYPGPWPLEGFVNELGGKPLDHVAPLEALCARGLVRRAEVVEEGRTEPGYEATDAGRTLFEESQRTIRSKWAFDGAETLSEAAAKLRAEADHLEELEREGWQLVGPVEDDYGHLLRTREGAEARQADAELSRQVDVEIESGRDRLSDLADR